LGIFKFAVAGFVRLILAKKMSYQSGAVVAVEPGTEKAQGVSAPLAPRVSPGSLSFALRRLAVALSAVVLLSLSLAPESGTQTRWSDSSFFILERADATSSATTSTTYAFRGDLYQGTWTGVTVAKTAAGVTTRSTDFFLSATGSMWDMFTTFGCLSKALSASDGCGALSTVLGMSIFVRMTLVASLVALLYPLVKLGEALLLARWCGEESTAEALVRVGGDGLKLPALVALGCTVFTLVAWPSAVSGALSALRNAWKADAGVADFSSTALLVRPGGGYFCVVGVAIAALWLWRGGAAMPSLAGFSWGAAVAPWRATPALERADDLSSAYRAVGSS
jgi:hypothetical protein